MIGCRGYEIPNDLPVAAAISPRSHVETVPKQYSTMILTQEFWSKSGPTAQQTQAFDQPLRHVFPYMIFILSSSAKSSLSLRKPFCLQLKARSGK